MKKNGSQNINIVLQLQRKKYFLIKNGKITFCSEIKEMAHFGMNNLFSYADIWGKSAFCKKLEIDYFDLNVLLEKERFAEKRDFRSTIW